MGTAPQSGDAPYSIQVESSYVAGATLTGMAAKSPHARYKLFISLCFHVSVNISISENGRGLEDFRGFMIQARASENEEAFGEFVVVDDDNKTKTFGCPVDVDAVSSHRDKSSCVNQEHTCFDNCRTAHLTEILIQCRQWR